MPSCVVCVSGGVDSSIAAYLLKKQGFDIIGLFLKLTGTKNEQQAIDITKKILSHIKIDLRIEDRRQEFKAKVIRYFEKSYLSGKTPNACVICNPIIKFSTAFKVAKLLGYDFVATGHYARVLKCKEILLLKAKDLNKDQSYFLHQIEKDDLKKIIFPLGSFIKQDVKKIAEDIGIARFIQKESQDICFFKGDYRQFLKMHFDNISVPGPIVTKDGKIIGRHKGLFNYTIGQRRGLGIPDKTPFYVLNIDVASNSLMVGKEDELFKKEFFVKGINWLFKPSEHKFQCKVKIRSRHKAQIATVYPINDKTAKVIFTIPQKAITPGQFAVFYKGLVVVGGGEICE